MDYGQSDRSRYGKVFEKVVHNECVIGIGNNMHVEAYVTGELPKDMREILKTPHPETKGQMELHDVDVSIFYDGTPVIAIHCRSNMDEIQKPLIAVRRMRAYPPTSSIFHVVATLDKGRNGEYGHLSAKGFEKHGRSYSMEYDAVYSWRPDVLETPGIMPDGNFSKQIVRSHKHFCSDLIFPLIKHGKLEFEKFKAALIDGAHVEESPPTQTTLSSANNILSGPEF